RRRLPLCHVGIVARELSIGRDDTKLFLPRQSPLAQLVPAVIKFALVFVGPFLRHVMRRVSGARAEVHKEGFIWGDLLGIGDETDRFIYQVFGQMVAFFRCLLCFNRVFVVEQLGIILVCLAAEKTVESLEAAS